MIFALKWLAGSPVFPLNRFSFKKEKWRLCLELPSSAAISANALLPLPLLPMIATKSWFKCNSVWSSQVSESGAPSDFLTSNLSMKRLLFSLESCLFGGVDPINDRFAGSFIACFNPSNVGFAFIQVAFPDG